MCVENQCRGMRKVKGENSYRCLLQKNGKTHLGQNIAPLK